MAKILGKILTKILAKIPAKILAKIYGKILTKISAKILAKILARILAKTLARIPAKVLAKILAKISAKILTKIHAKIFANILAKIYGKIWLCIKVGQGQGDGDIGTRLWGLGDARRRTWGHQVWDTGTCGMGTRDVKYRDAGTPNTGMRGTLMIIAKVRVKCDISFFVKMCYLLSTLDSIVQNHIRQLMMFTQNISLYRSKRTDYHDKG